MSDRVELIEGDARETIETVGGPIDLLFVDAAKDEYESYIELAEPKLSERAVLVVDNMLMSGEVALAEGENTGWRTGVAGDRPGAQRGAAGERPLAGLRAAGGRRHRVRDKEVGT